MKKLLIAAGLAFAAGIAAKTLMTGDAVTAETAASGRSETAVVSFDRSLPLEARIAALEQALSDERQARQLLQEEVLVLNDAIEQMRPGGAPPQPSAQPAEPPSEEPRRTAVRDRMSPERRVERFLAAGFTAAEADWIMRREAELQMEALQERYDARRSGEPVGFFSSRGSARTALRDELGDADYERYLTANGRPTSIAVSSVLDGSPALAAGLRPGDQIVSYDGRRVFNMSEDNALTMQGEAGENVVVDITRDGIPMQVALPRGPLGITGGRRR